MRCWMLLVLLAGGARGAVVEVRAGEAFLAEKAAGLDDGSGEMLGVRAGGKVSPWAILHGEALWIETEMGADVSLPVVLAGVTLGRGEGVVRPYAVLGAGYSWVRGVTAGVVHEREGVTFSAGAGVSFQVRDGIGITLEAGSLWIDGAGRHDIAAVGVRFGR